MEIDAARGVVLNQENCEIAGVLAKDSSVRFDCLEKSLPFPVVDDAAGALELVPFIKDLNQETLRVSGLAAGRYEILIDSQSVLQVSAAALAEGVNLAIIKDTPQYRQATEVFKLLSLRADIVGNKLRAFAEIQHGFLSRLKKRSPESDQKAVEAKLAEMRITKGPHSAYYIGVYESYLRNLPERESLTRRAAELLDEAYKTAQPKSHRYEVHPLR
jgi:endoglucanase